MARSAIAETITGTNVVAANQIYGDVYQNGARPVAEYVLDFDLESAADGFVGRDDVIAELNAFAANWARGYFEIVGEAGLGKTALAAEIARRRNAIAFLAGGGVRRPEQFLTHTSAALIVRHGLGYKTLPDAAGDNDLFLRRVLRESVERTNGRPLWLVVDGIDEAEEPPAGANPLLMPQSLPDGVYAVVTRRAGSLAVDPRTSLRRWTLRRDSPQQTADIERFIRAQLKRDERLRAALAGVRPATSEDEFVARLTDVSEGNFMYLSYLLADMVADLPVDMTDLPVGLLGYYDRLWERMGPSQATSWADWESRYQPVLELLAVAAEAVTANWFAAQLGRSSEELRLSVLEPWARVLSREQHGGVVAWRVVHRTFAEYLGGKLELGAAHRKVAVHYVESLWGRFPEWDDYGLRHAAGHLAEAADRTPAGQRHALVNLLVRLATNQEFQRAHHERLREPTLLRRDLELAQRLAAEDDDPEGTFLMVPVALTLVQFRRQLLRPEGVFDAARRGNIGLAERLLDLLVGEIDQDWRSAILLTIAWLASDTAPDVARHLRDRIGNAAGDSQILARLIARVSAALDGGRVDLPRLPQAPPPDVAYAMVAELEGSVLDSLGYYARARRGELLRAGHYLAEADGPPLVATALSSPEVGDELLRRYLAVHVAYGYREYRNGSLWALLGAIVLHPDPRWVRDWLDRLGVAVLAAPNRGEFLEALEIAVLGLQVLHGDARAHRELTERSRAALEQAAALPVEPLRGQGDVWGVHRRRLAALAETVGRLPDGVPRAIPLLRAGLDIGRGFAGFSAPVSLTLAETASIVAPEDAYSIQRALDAAEKAAHNIQDPTFCVRTTARIAAMRTRWWSKSSASALEPAAVVARMSRDPASPEFGTVHVVGEPYVYRDRVGSVPLGGAETANTLVGLAQLYQRPLQDFLNHNEASGWGHDESLPVGTQVNVPDPGFAPLLAARLSAAILASGPPGAVRSAIARHLVPVCGVDVTALATVMSRMLLGSPATDAEILGHLRRLAAEAAAASAAE